MRALEDVAAHIHPSGPFGDHRIGHGQRFRLRKLLPAGHDNGHRAGCHHLFKIFTVIRLHQLNAHLRHDPRGQLKEAVSPFHILSYCHHAQGRDAVTHARADDPGQIVDAGELPVCTDKGLHRHTVRIHPDGILHIHSHHFMRQIIIQHGRTRSYPERDPSGDLRRNTGAKRPPGPHEHIHIRRQLRQKKVQPLQPRRRAHKISVVERKHHRITALRMKNIGQMLLHPPVQSIRTFYIETFLIGKRNIHMVILRHFQTVFIRHSDSFLSCSFSASADISFPTNIPCPPRLCQPRRTLPDPC